MMFVKLVYWLAWAFCAVYFARLTGNFGSWLFVMSLVCLLDFLREAQTLARFYDGFIALRQEMETAIEKAQAEVSEVRASIAQFKDGAS
jgi:hypothetical protein